MLEILLRVVASSSRSFKQMPQSIHRNSDICNLSNELVEIVNLSMSLVGKNLNNKPRRRDLTFSFVGRKNM